MLATGGIGRAFKITSNSWEYTGDGHALAYRAGAELKDMEFVQFHPTGMVWPISVRGILVTEGVRGEGGVLRNNEGRRFMFDEIPDLYKAQTADNEEEGWRYTQGDKNARRPPELLTRDHVARCINREVKAGRGTPHGGVFLDIAWIKERMPKSRGTHQAQAPQHVSPVQAARRYGYHQRADGSRPYHALHDGRQSAWMAIRRCPPYRDCSPRAKLPPGCTARTGWAEIRFPICSCSGGAPGGMRPNSRKNSGSARLTRPASGGRDAALKPFDRGPAGENPYQIQYDLQESMQDLVGIVRTESEMEQALE